MCRRCEVSVDKCYNDASNMFETKKNGVTNYHFARGGTQQVYEGDYIICDVMLFWVQYLIGQNEIKKSLLHSLLTSRS